MQDIVAQYPSLWLELQEADELDETENEFEEGFTARIGDDHFFIHARAVLPLKDLDTGIGFGLWVEVERQDYEKYLKVVDIDEEYKDYSAEGRLAQEWPGFPDTEGLKVRIRPARVEEKIYITEILEKPSDIALEMALQMSPDDEAQKDMVRKMIMAYLG